MYPRRPIGLIWCSVADMIGLIQQIATIAESLSEAEAADMVAMASMPALVIQSLFMCSSAGDSSRYKRSRIHGSNCLHAWLNWWYAGDSSKYKWARNHVCNCPKACLGHAMQLLTWSAKLIQEPWRQMQAAYICLYRCPGYSCRYKL